MSMPILKMETNVLVSYFYWLMVLNRACKKNTHIILTFFIVLNYNAKDIFIGLTGELGMGRCIKSSISKYINLFSGIFLFINLTDSHALMVVQLSIPKCGSHLLHKCLNLLIRESTYESYVENEKFANISKDCNCNYPMAMYHNTQSTTIHPIIAEYLKNPSPSKNILINSMNHTNINHLPAIDENIKIMNNPLIRLFLIVRDPRDQVVSFAYFMMKSQPGWYKETSLSLNDIISNLITSGSIHYPLHCIFQRSITGFYDLFLPWIKLKNTCLIRFENLVGPLGGGSEAIQIKEIRKIATHMGLQLGDEKLREIAQQLFGNTNTFREGQIGSWRKVLTPKHKVEFSQTFGAAKLVKELGYASDDSWLYS